MLSALRGRDGRPNALARLLGVVVALLLAGPVTVALLRAVTARDMPAREGLLRAPAPAPAARAHPRLSLEAASTDPDSPTRAYARAALHTLGPATAP